MKIKICLPIIWLLCLISPFLSAQLTLTRAEGGKTRTIDYGQKITLKLPTKSAPCTGPCDYFQAYTGKLKQYHQDTFNMVIEEYQRVYFDEGNIAKKETVEYHYADLEISTTLFANDIISISQKSKSRENRFNFGATLLLLSAIQGLVVSPFLSDKSKKVSEKFVFGGLGLGIVLMVLPQERTYYFKPPQNGKKKKLWQIKN